MEPDQQPLLDDQKLQTFDETSKPVEVAAEKLEKVVVSVETDLPETKVSSESSKDDPVEQKKSSEVELVEQMKKEDKNPEDEKSFNAKESSTADCDSLIAFENDHEVKSSDGSSKAESNLPSFPGTVTKSVPGSNDVKIEIDSNSLLDRVILYSLKNTVVDNSRLDAAKSKYMLNNGNITSNFNNYSNESDSNSSSKSAEKLIDEFKVFNGCVNDNVGSSPIDVSIKGEKSDTKNGSNGAEKYINFCNSSSIDNRDPFVVNENHQNVISSSPEADKRLTDAPPKSVQQISEPNKAEICIATPEFVPPKPNIENEALDFRDKTCNENSREALPTMLDLSVPHREEKSVPPIKRNLALYVGLPDFSKQIFSAPSISRPANSIGPPKIKNPDFSAISQSTSELQARHPDASSPFANSERPRDVAFQITPSNFPEIVRKNNYISDLQLKPAAKSTNSFASSPSSSSSYKIDYHSSAAISQKLTQEQKPEKPSTSHTIYPNMKKEGINAYNQQLIIEEPMAHIIHKNQFLPLANEPGRMGAWTERNERLLGGSSKSQGIERLPHSQAIEANSKPQIPSTSHNYNEDLQRSNPAYHPQSNMEREINENAHEIQMSHEFSLKQKEQQLRQEGTIITVKNESVKTPTRETNERRSADLFRDYKLKQPKESPDSLARVSENSMMGYQQTYPDFPAQYPKYNNPPKVETVLRTSKGSPASPSQYSQKPIATNIKNFQTPSNSSYHQPKSPLTCPPGSLQMNPPQHWPPPLVQQHFSRQIQNPTSNIPSTSQQNFQHPSSSRSPSFNNYGYNYPLPAPPGPTAVKVSQGYQPYGLIRSSDLKEIHNRQFKPVPSSSAELNYYHQKYPDFSRHFGMEKMPHGHDANVKYQTSFIPLDHRPDMSYQRFPQPHEISNAREADQNYYVKTREKEPAMIAHDYPPRVQDSINRHQELPQRPTDDGYDRSRAIRPMKVERQIEEPPKIVAGPSTLHLRRPEPEVSVVAKVKIEPVLAPARSNVLMSNIVKSPQSIFAEVKRESPLDLSVKTVKTKADSTGCDQDIPFRHRAEPSGLKVEFTPNFGKISRTDCRQQARMGQQQNIPTGRSAPPSGSQKYANEIDNRTPPSSFASQGDHHRQQLPVASSSRTFPHDQRYQPVKDPERIPSLPNNPQFPDRLAYPDEINQMHQLKTVPLDQNHFYKEIPRPENKPQADAKRVNSYYLPHQAVTTCAPVNKINNLFMPAQTDVPRPSNHVQSHNANPRSSLNHEREKDRKYVEDILNRRNRKESFPVHHDMRHYQPIVPPPRKRVIENQLNMSNSLPPKMGKLEEPSRSVPEPYYQKMQNHVPPQQFVQKFPRRESHSKILPLIGQPPALIKNDSFINSVSQSYDAEYYPIDAPQVAVKPDNPSQYPDSHYYPNPKAEMIHRSDPANVHKQGRSQLLNQNFQQRPDDINLQTYPRIHHPVQQENAIKKEHQTAGPLPGTSGESSRMSTIPLNVSGSNGNIARGADQSTILKLKTNLELKEQKKLFINKIECVDDCDQPKKDLSPRQFRTKGELKGFIPLAASNAIEPKNSPALPAAPSEFDLLDWGSACNDFVQQLENGKKKPKLKRLLSSSRNIEMKMENKTSNEIPGTTVNNLSEVPEEIMKSLNKAIKTSSSDEDKPLLLLVNNQNVGSDSKKALDGNPVGKVSEKVSRNFREKQRLELEQKLAARLGQPSSSESDSEAKKASRTTKRVRRLRKRAALGIKKTDEEQSVEEMETEEELNRKKQSSTHISKLDDLTSSDDEKKKYSVKDRKSQDDRKQDGKSAKTSKSETSNKDARKHESASNVSGSDEPTKNKITKLSKAKNVKRLKDLGDGSSFKNLLEEDETMTRSKRRLEIEKKLSNSKILRNEKIVQNVSPDKKSKIETPQNTSSASKKGSQKKKDSPKPEDCKRRNNGSDSDNSPSKTKKIPRLEGSSSSSSDEHVEEEIKVER